MNMKINILRDVLMTIAQICIVTALFLETNMKSFAIVLYVLCIIFTLLVNISNILRNKNKDKTSINNKNI